MKDQPSPIWACRICCAQMFGGPRCAEHNPSPEERDMRAFWRPALDALDQVDPTYITPYTLAWLIEEVGDLFGQRECAAQIAQELIESGVSRQTSVDPAQAAYAF